MARWGARAVVGKTFDCLADWREVAENVSGRVIDCGHFIPEEAPQESLDQIHAFIGRHEKAAA